MGLFILTRDSVPVIWMVTVASWLVGTCPRKHSSRSQLQFNSSPFRTIQPMIPIHIFCSFVRSFQYRAELMPKNENKTLKLSCNYVTVTLSNVWRTVSYVATTHHTNIATVALRTAHEEKKLKKETKRERGDELGITLHEALNYCEIIWSLVFVLFFDHDGSNILCCSTISTIFEIW